MALFSLTDIKFKQDRSIRKLPLVEEKYRTNILKYPIDIGDVDKGHYMVIHINVQEKTMEQNKGLFTEASGDVPKIQRNRQILSQQGITNIGGSADLASSLIREGAKALSGVTEKLSDNTVGNIVKNVYGKIKNNPIGNNILEFGGGTFDRTLDELKGVNTVNLARKIKRTTETIALYMPDTLFFGQNQSYASASPGGEPLAILNAAGSTIKETIQSGGPNMFRQLGSNMAPFLSPYLKNVAGRFVGQNSAEIYAYTAFGVVNPQMELLYSRPEFRSFSFDFAFYPRSEQEALEIQRIITSLQYHQVPEMDKGTAGYFLTPPSEFDIDFYYNGTINPNISNISTCVLTSINVNYAPGGFASYESPETFGYPKLGSTGMPYAITLQLNFQETEIMTKFNYKEKYRMDPNQANQERDL